jgi:hypothetical protein
MSETKITPAEVEVTPAAWLRFSWPEACKNEPITAFHRDFLQKIEADIFTLDPSVEPDGDVFRIAVLVITGGTLVGPFVDRLIALTGFPRTLVRHVCHNMFSAGIWEEFSTDAEWIDEAGYRPTAFWCHTLVASGMVTAKWDSEKSAWCYQAAPVT